MIVPHPTFWMTPVAKMLILHENIAFKNRTCSGQGDIQQGAGTALNSECNGILIDVIHHCRILTV